MATDIAVTVSMGVMKPLLDKLIKLMGDKYKKIKGLRKVVSFLQHELSDMSTLLEKMDDADELDPQAKKWRKDIIEMSYDIEDYIDEFMDRVGEASNNVGLLRKASRYLRTFKDRQRLADKFEEIKNLVIEAGERRKRYSLDQCIQSTTHVTIDPRLSVIYQNSESLVGIDGQKEEIVKWVMDEEQQLKVMSIVGFGGLGKTTLANEVSREVSVKFSCKAFVSISQNPDIMKLLNSLLSQLGLQPYFHACELHDPIKRIRAHLQDQRYFVIIDDLWDIQAWNIIRCAFPKNNHYSRVLITTRIETVARASCGNHGFIHHMKPLSEQDSRKLFFDRICESEDACPPNFIEVSCKILKKCGGLPLAITTMASMIACQPTRSKGQWAEYIENSLDDKFSSNPTYEDMIHILDFSYKNLPHHLKACFLYLSTYPEDHKIQRVELVRRWVAEGFISCSSGHDVWDVAESYFSELVNRNMIQPAYDDYDYHDFMVTHCKVHDMMLELTLRKCKEDNFIRLIDSPEMMLEEQEKTIRRLTINSRRGAESGITVVATAKNLSQVRSLSIFRGNCRIPNLKEFKFIRLIFLDASNFEMTIDLSGINHLSQLRYLKVIGRCGNKLLLSAQIQGLQLLETLDLSEMSNYCSIPEITDVPHLSHISVQWGKGVRLPDGIGKVKSLLTLSEFSLPRSSLKSIMDLGKLTSLSKLSLTYWEEDSRGMMPSSTMLAALITSLEKLSNLKELTLSAGIHMYCCGDAMVAPSFSPPFCRIEQLCLYMLLFSKVPRWIGHLRCLCVLNLRVKQIYEEDFNVIGTELASLVVLDMTISSIPTEMIVIGSSTGFKVLKYFGLTRDEMSCLAFEAGAMPNLQVLEIGIIDPIKWDKTTPIGLQHLPSLKRIRVSTTSRNVQEQIVGVFQKAADALPSRPAIDTSLYL